MFERFDFRKESDQKKASELSPEDQQKLIKESHASALKRNKKLDKLSKQSGKTPGEIDRKLQAKDDREMARYKEQQKRYDDARFKDRTYGGIHSPVVRPRKPTFED